MSITVSVTVPQAQPHLLRLPESEHFEAAMSVGRSLILAGESWQGVEDAAMVALYGNGQYASLSLHQVARLSMKLRAEHAQARLSKGRAEYEADPDTVPVRAHRRRLPFDASRMRPEPEPAPVATASAAAPVTPLFREPILIRISA